MSTTPPSNTLRVKEGKTETNLPHLYEFRDQRQGDGVNPQYYLRFEARLSAGEPVRTSYAANKFSSAVQSNPEATNKALDKLYSECNQAEALRVAWLEREKAIELVTETFKLVVRVVRAVKRRDPNFVRSILKKNPEAKDILKQPASLWLVYWFGIVPTIADMHHALGVFATPFPEVDLSVTGGSNFDFNWDGYPTEYINLNGTAICKIGGTLSSINTSLDLASRLGFGQPLSVAYEMMAFSWLLDYAVNVGQLLKNLEPRFPGLVFTKQYHTYFGTGTASYRLGPPFRNPEQTLSSWDCYFMQRLLGWPNYKLAFTSPLDLKLKQASYIVAVAIQLLTGLKKK